MNAEAAPAERQPRDVSVNSTDESVILIIHLAGGPDIMDVPLLKNDNPNTVLQKFHEALLGIQADISCKADYDAQVLMKFNEAKAASRNKTEESKVQ